MATYSTRGPRLLRWILPALAVAVLSALGVGAYLRYWPGEICPSAAADLTREASWARASALPTPRSEIALARVGNRVYVSGGIGLGGSLDTFEVYDARDDRWTELAPLPTPLHHHGLAALGNRVYAAGGYTDLRMSPTAAAWSYDPQRNIWGPIASLPRPRAAFVLLPFAGGLVAVGGAGKNARDLWRYDPETNTWAAFGSPLPSAREHHAAVVSGGNLYVLGGRWEQRNLNTVEMYYPAEGRWLERAPMPTARSGISAAEVAGKIHVIGGEDLQDDCVFDSHEAYEPALDRWEVAPQAPTGRHGLGVVTVGNRLLVIGGAERPGILTPLSVTSKVEVLAVEGRQ